MLISLIYVRFDRLEARTMAEVCSRYKSDVSSISYSFSGKPPYPDQQGTCTQYRYDKESDDNKGLKELNYMRWLVGFNTPVTLDSRYDYEQVQCAICNVKNRRLNHRPSTSTPCYSTAAYAGCSTSNLGAGYGSFDAARAVQQFIQDPGVYNENLGHRRWVFSEGLTSTAFGGAYNSVSSYQQGFTNSVAMKTTMKFGEGTLLFTAYPSPGYFPARFIYNRFSFWAPGIRERGPLQISVSIDGEPQRIGAIVYTTGNYGGNQRGAMFNLTSYPEDRLYQTDYQKLIGRRIDVQVEYNYNVYEYTILPVDCDSAEISTPTPNTPIPITPVQNTPTTKPNITDPPSDHADMPQTNTMQPDSTIPTSENKNQGNETGNQVSNNGSDNGMKKKLIIGIVVGLVLVVIIIVVAIIVIKKASSSQNNNEVEKTEEISTFSI
ncbi:hypothetical protein TVAG_184250 [Trichomonas vaginalis G3]|uniref:SCP domain-containing protein n=1 Tax=Trichomonas vaginalis (strain ATCC PRA-98 / G3) TaxID=412133 RepID=A2E9W1_TRIV3|nr:hypothetical protein TVAGG3_0221270 [Trichomonas vaginalis G3]EAY10523.1 hypothetical protein TVAG_184250 [Trichomonas vaginalis G3]KAI5551961.1 hypothetical protein TVAGG3_0221270 [Trichomonas vaginalis G3]|eukprot:XP_001322746.1 hypothetical protein [Trichomonas vaginalis G3]